MPFTLQAIALAVAAVRRVQCAKVTNVGFAGDWGLLGGKGDLIARVPFSVVDVSSDAGAIGVVA